MFCIYILLIRPMQKRRKRMYRACTASSAAFIATGLMQRAQIRPPNLNFPPSMPAQPNDKPKATVASESAGSGTTSKVKFADEKAGKITTSPPPMSVQQPQSMIMLESKKDLDLDQDSSTLVGSTIRIPSFYNDPVSNGSSTLVVHSSCHNINESGSIAKIGDQEEGMIQTGNDEKVEQPEVTIVLTGLENNHDCCSNGEESCSRVSNSCCSNCSCSNAGSFDCDGSSGATESPEPKKSSPLEESLDLDQNTHYNDGDGRTIADGKKEPKNSGNSYNQRGQLDAKQILKRQLSNKTPSPTSSSSWSLRI